MNDFKLYFGWGWEHIISADALDHQLFILVLAALYTIKEWKPVLILVTAFTIGHSITLALSTLNIVTIPSQWVEFLIPCTIAFTAASNFLVRDLSSKSFRPNYILALAFGLVHGLGFANTLRFTLASNQDLLLPLLSFNLGLEAGQIVVVLLILLVAYAVIYLLKLNRKWWVWGVSAMVFLFALKMAAERWPV